MKKIVKILTITLLILLLLLLIGLGVYQLLSPYIIEVDVSKINENNKVNLTVKIKSFFNDKIYCQITEEELDEKNWTISKDNKCSFEVDAGDYKIYLKRGNQIIDKKVNKKIEINKVLSIKPTKEKIYLPIDGEEKIEVELLTLGEIDKTLTYKVENENIAYIENTTVHAKEKGKTNIIITSVDGNEAKVELIVTNLIIKQVINNKKAKLTCQQYTEEEAHLLDEILFDRVNSVGYATRASVVEAARFLTMSLPVKIPYFFENGRLNNHPGRPKADGEGRYYHKGLYLSTDKIEEITAIKAGPAIWGCPLMNYQTEAGFIGGRKYPNGLSCSGFVSWVLYNGGFDVGDSGAGDFTYRDDDLCDLGERVELTYELMQSGKVKVGDLIGRDGHIAIIVGLDENNIYIAESLAAGVNVETFERYRGVVDSNLYGYIMLMDSVYKEDGKLTTMWDL